MKITASRWVPAVVAACPLFLAVSAFAADETYAVVALFGDDLTVVSYQSTTGSSLDRNVQQHVALNDGRYDRLATEASMTAIRNALPGARIEALTIPDEALAGGLDASLPSLIETVKGKLKEPDTHYLLVIGKYRGDAHLKVASGTIGSGKLEGIGFYIDSYLRMKQSNTGESGRGFVAPFAYLTVSLVDLRTGAVVRSESASESMTRANTGPSTTLNPWDAMTPEQKVRALDVVVRKALLWAVPRVVAPA